MGDVSFEPGNILHGTLLILGNGFDLDLGYPTSYKQFYMNTNSEDCGGFPFAKNGYHSDLAKFIVDTITINNWYDLEDVLAEYGEKLSQLTQSTKEKDKKDYETLVTQLKRYLSSIDYSKPNRASIAARILESAKTSLVPPVIYSFNYTDMNAIGNALGMSIDPVFHIHGSLANNDIILGAGDYANLGPAADYLYKAFNAKYRSTNLFHELDICDTIIIFGSSLSRVDYPYFASFFKKISSGGYGSESKKYIRIFTRDDESRMDLLRNLRVMNSGIIQLSNYSNFDIIRTKDNVDDKKVSEVCKLLESNWSFDIE